MNSLHHLVAYNTHHLEQGLALLESLTDEQYTATRPSVFESGVGEHLRHVLEHYECFLEGAVEGEVDYDARRRNTEISSDRVCAAATIRQLIQRLDTFSRVDNPVRIKMASSRSDESSPWSDSTWKRELQYLLAHTIHHYALIAMILRMEGIQPSDDFGVAPSTLRFRRSTMESV